MKTGLAQLPHAVPATRLVSLVVALDLWKALEYDRVHGAIVRLRNGRHCVAIDLKCELTAPWQEVAFA